MFGIRKENKKTRMTEDEVVAVIKKCYDDNNFNYNYDSKKVFLASFKGDDYPIRTMVNVTDLSIQFACLVDFKAEPDKFPDVCLKLNDINRLLRFGAFYLDPDDGTIAFEYGFIYVESHVSPEMVGSILGLVIETVDQHDGEIKSIATGGDKSSNPMFG